MGAPDSSSRLSDRRELVALLGELGGSLGQRFAAIAATERLTSAQWNLLRLLDEPQQMGWVARTLRCDPSNVTGLTRKLVDGGFAEVVPDPASARVRLLRRTAAGTRACRRLEKRLFEDFRPEGGLSATELRTLTGLLAQVAAGWRQLQDA
ncbi:MAG: MarR family winged helix-turn-helix transcriptional regulator [Dermatophilaceae bacterium]